MFFSQSLPETQAALALAIFLATFIYEDGATLLAATASASGALDPRRPERQAAGFSLRQIEWNPS